MHGQSAATRQQGFLKATGANGLVLPRIDEKNMKRLGFPTWRIIPVSKYLITPIYKPFRPFGSGTTPVRGLTKWDDPPSTVIMLQKSGYITPLKDVSKPVVNNGRNYQTQQVSRSSSINSKALGILVTSEVS